MRSVVEKKVTPCVTLRSKIETLIACNEGLLVQQWNNWTISDDVNENENAEMTMLFQRRCCTCR